MSQGGVISSTSSFGNLTGLALFNGSSPPTAVSFTDATAFTPSVAINGSGVGVTYTTQAGDYQRIGSIIYVSGRIILSNKGASNGNVTITGLPVVAGVSGNNYIFNVYASNVTFTANYVQAYGAVNTSATTMGVFQAGTGQAVIAVTDANLANTSSFFFTGFYGVN